MPSFWWKDIQLIVNAGLWSEARWIHSKDLPSFFEKWEFKRMWLGSGLADKTVGITGLRENFGRDGGIERPYWGPSKENSQNLTHKKSFDHRRHLKSGVPLWGIYFANTKLMLIHAHCSMNSDTVFGWFRVWLTVSHLRKPILPTDDKIFIHLFVGFSWEFVFISKPYPQLWIFLILFTYLLDSVLTL